MIKTPLLGSNSFDANPNTNALNATMEYVLSTERFEELLFQWKQEIFKQDYESLNSVTAVIVTCLFCIILYYL